MKKIILSLTALMALGFAADHLVSSASSTEYRLVGYGCEGSNGTPLYAMEEDEFPRCDIIRRVK